MKRNCGMVLRFTKAEMDGLTKKARKAGLSREGYCRHVLNGSQVKSAPPADLPVLIQEVRRVGGGLEQLIKAIAHDGRFDAQELQAALVQNRAVEKLIIGTYTTG